MNLKAPQSPARSRCSQRSAGFAENASAMFNGLVAAMPRSVKQRSRRSGAVRLRAEVLLPALPVQGGGAFALLVQCAALPSPVLPAGHAHDFPFSVKKSQNFFLFSPKFSIFASELFCSGCSALLPTGFGTRSIWRWSV